MSQNFKFKATMKLSQSENPSIFYYKMKFFDNFDSDFVNWLQNNENFVDLEVKNLQKAQKIEIYTLENCVYCTQAKEFLQTRGISFIEYNYNRNDFTVEDLKKRMNTNQESISAPVVFVDDKYIGGFSEVVKGFST